MPPDARRPRSALDGLRLRRPARLPPRDVRDPSPPRPDTWTPRRPDTPVEVSVGRSPGGSTRRSTERGTGVCGEEHRGGAPGRSPGEEHPGGARGRRTGEEHKEAHPGGAQGGARGRRTAGAGHGGGGASGCRSSRAPELGGRERAPGGPCWGRQRGWGRARSAALGLGELPGGARLIQDVRQRSLLVAELGFSVSAPGLCEQKQGSGLRVAGVMQTTVADAEEQGAAESTAPLHSLQRHSAPLARGQGSSVPGAQRPVRGGGSDGAGPQAPGGCPPSGQASPPSWGSRWVSTPRPGCPPILGLRVGVHLQARLSPPSWWSRGLWQRGGDGRRDPGLLGDPSPHLGATPPPVDF